MSLLPEGRYLSCATHVHPDNAGQTNAMLMRNRIFAERTGIVPSVLTFDDVADLEERRAVLTERGQLAHGVDLLNIFEHYRDTDWPDDDPSGRPLKNLGPRLSEETALPDGTPWRVSYEQPSGSTLHDYLRPDGTTFLRMPAFDYEKADTWPRRLVRVSRTGDVVGEFSSVGRWYRRWVREMSQGHERSFAFIDSRYLAPFLAPLRARHIHLVYLLHNIHVSRPWRWDSDTSEVYARLLEAVGEFDAFVTLTERQREDIAERCGPRSNMFVVSNPVEPPPLPAVVERDPRLVSVVARLEGQKRLTHAIGSFRRVLRQVPDARLEIYGAGSRQSMLQAMIDRRGMNASVGLMGHDPRARQTLWHSSAFLLTSFFEGYPLSTLESMSHGCPVVAYDIRYGPREQVTDGVDGYLVEDGNEDQLAERVVQLLKDPDLVHRMSVAAREKAEHHGYDRFVADWVEVLHAAADLKPGRTRIAKAALEVTRLSVGTARPRGTSARAATPGAFSPDRRLRFEGRLSVRGKSKDGSLGDATVTLAAVHEGSGHVVDVPLEVRFEQGTFHLKTSVRLGDLYAGGDAATGRTHLRLRLSWRNSAWQTVVRRPRVAGPVVEVSYDDDVLYLAGS